VESEPNCHGIVLYVIRRFLYLHLAINCWARDTTFWTGDSDASKMCGCRLTVETRTAGDLADTLNWWRYTLCETHWFGLQFVQNLWLRCGILRKAILDAHIRCIVNSFPAFTKVLDVKSVEVAFTLLKTEQVARLSGKYPLKDILLSGFIKWQ